MSILYRHSTCSGLEIAIRDGLCSVVADWLLPHSHRRERIWTEERMEGCRVLDGYSQRTKRVW